MTDPTQQAGERKAFESALARKGDDAHATDRILAIYDALAQRVADAEAGIVNEIEYVATLRAELAAAVERAEKVEGVEGDRITNAFMDQLTRFFKSHGGDGYLGGEGADSADPADWISEMAVHVAVHFINERDDARAEIAALTEQRDALRAACEAVLRSTEYWHGGVGPEDYNAECAALRAALGTKP